MHDFLCKFPDVYKPRLNKNISKDLLLALFEFDKKNLADRAQLIQRSVDADYSVLKNFVSNEAEYEKVVMSFKPVVTTPDIVD
jgi:hypothetical protein